MKILGIETSCDETAIAVIDIGNPSTNLGGTCVEVLSNIISSQANLHSKFGGVVPNLAKREHQRNLAYVLLAALNEAKLLNSKIPPAPRLQPGLRRAGKNQKSKLQFKIKKLNEILSRELDLLGHFKKHILLLQPPQIDAIAVTIGPGLAPALWVGVNFARALAYIWKKPIIPVNHLEGHIYTNLFPHDENDQIDETDKIVRSSQLHQAKRFSNFTNLITLRFPALCLIVSGGHTELVLMRGCGRYRIIGETLDDAAGEAFDKVAKMMNLAFPGGPEIAAEAAKIQNSKLKINLPRPMINSDNFDFSFSGLKTAALYALRDLTVKFPLAKIRPVMAREFQDAVVDVLVAKTIKAAKRYKAKTVMIGGGVAANEALRRQLGDALKRLLPATCYLLPDPALAGDNALMIALAGWFNRQKKKARRSLRAVPDLRLT